MNPGVCVRSLCTSTLYSQRICNSWFMSFLLTSNNCIYFHSSGEDVYWQHCRFKLSPSARSAGGVGTPKLVSFLFQTSSSQWGLLKEVHVKQLVPGWKSLGSENYLPITSKAGQSEFGFEIHYCRKKLPGCVNCPRTQTLTFCRVKTFGREQLASVYPVVPNRLCFPLCECLVRIRFAVGGSVALVLGTHLLWNDNIQSVQGPLGSSCCF